MGTKGKRNLEDRMTEIAAMGTLGANEGAKFDSGNASAGKRVRATLKEIQILLKEAKAYSLGKL